MCVHVCVRTKPVHVCATHIVRACVFVYKCVHVCLCACACV